MSKFLKFFILFLFFFISSSQAQTNFLDQLQNPNHHSIRIVPKNGDYTHGPITVQIKSSEFHAQLNWFSQTRTKVKSEPWPEYKVFLNKGMIQSDEIRQANFMTHPFLWKKGFIYLNQNTLIWAPKDIFEKEEIEFEIGLLNSDFKQFQTQDKKLTEAVSNFRTDIKTFEELQLLPNQFLSQGEKKDLDKFIQNYSKIKNLNEDTRPIVINGIKTEVPVSIWGNDYIKFSILKIPTNPLILTLEFDDSKIPQNLQNYFKTFKKNLEYVITQIKTD